MKASVVAGFFAVSLIAGGARAADPSFAPAKMTDAFTDLRVTHTLSSFSPVTPCRLVDTRGNGFTGAFGPPSLAAGSPRDFTVTGSCGITPDAVAVSLNVTVTNPTGPGFILAYPQGDPQPTVSVLNYVAGQTVANAAVVVIGASGGITIVAGVSGANLILDVNGFYATGATPDFSNILLGYSVGNPTMQGSFNVGIGGQALLSLTTGSDNSAVGLGSGLSLNSGHDNALFGMSAGHFATSGSNNTLIGTSAGVNISTGNGNVVVGLNAGSNLQSGSNNIYIDNPGFIENETGTIRIGNANHVGTIIAGISGQTAVGGVPVLISGGGRLGTSTSSARFKQDIRDMSETSDGLFRLRPVTFRYKPEIDPDGFQEYGLIAEEVEKIFPELVTHDDSGRAQAIRYQHFVPMLINELQKERRTTDLEEGRVRSLALALEEEKAKSQSLAERLERIEEALARGSN